MNQNFYSYGNIYKKTFLAQEEYKNILSYLQSLYPIWEKRTSDRWLLRPVYWLGNWQFACLDYYHPPKGIQNRCVFSDPYPSLLSKKVKQIETIVKSEFQPRDIPHGWHLNTCLINYYGDSLVTGKPVDCARVGEHKDFEPGPVASLSFGERALFQFVQSDSKFAQSKVIQQIWLEDNSLQIFGGDRYKKKLFHRVQRVERKQNFEFTLNNIDNFKTRRINLTFRYVPKEHIKPYHQLPLSNIQQTIKYVQNLSHHSENFAYELKKVLAQSPELITF